MKLLSQLGMCLMAASLSVGCAKKATEATETKQPIKKEAPAPKAEASKPAAKKVIQNGSPLAIGAALVSADVKMKNIDGKELSIKDSVGEKGTLVIFTCNACPWVKKWEDRIAAVSNDYAKKGIGVIAINSNDPSRYEEDSYEEMKKRSEKLKLQFPYVVDGTSEVARAFGASKTPEVFLFDANNKLVYHGAVDDNAADAATVKQNYLKDALEAVSTGAKVPLAETKALGCSIKWRS